MADFFDKLLSERGMALTVLGALLFALGIIGQVTGWFPAIAEMYRWITMAAGAIVAGIGITFLIIDGGAKNPYGIRILLPKENDRLSATINVEGIIRRRPLPEGKELWLLRIYPEHGRFVPMQKASIRDDGSWVADKCTIGGMTDESRTIGAYVVDASARIFFEHFDFSNTDHKGWMKAVKVPGGAEWYLPPIKGDPAKIKSMKKCHEVTVKRI